MQKRDSRWQSRTGVIGADNYRNLIRKARLDKSIKAIVFRVNSGGGSSMASETIWRELSLAKQENL
jgi:protease-4